MKICTSCGKTHTRRSDTCIECYTAMRKIYQLEYQKQKKEKKEKIMQPSENKGSSLSEKLKKIASDGMTYAELQKAETIRLYGRVEL